MAQQINLEAKGLHTYENQLSAIPNGALLEATNIIINRINTIESRRGFKLYGDSLATSVDRPKQLIEYKDTIIRHYTDKLDFDSNNNGDFIEFSGSYSEPEDGIRIKFQEANGNLFFTTDEGIKKISATSAANFSSNSGYILDAGAPKALEIQTQMNYETAGFSSTESKVSYRVVWGYTDANNNLVLGVPSPRSIVTNRSTDTTGTVDVTISIPQTVTVNYFYQVYRTAVVQRTTGLTFEDIDPGDEHYLVFEGNPTAAEIASREVVYNDIVPEDFRAGGALLYTNPISGEGIAQANEIPPLAKDITLYKNNMFYANTRTRHRLQTSLLTISDFKNNFEANDISVANPTVITTTTEHGLNDGDYVYIYNSDSTPSIDGTHEITYISDTTFSIDVDVTVAGTTAQISQTPRMLISNEGSSIIYSFRGVTEETEITTVDAASLPAGPDFGYTLINSYNDLRKYFFWFDTSVSSDGNAPSNDDTLGRIPIKVNAPPGSTDEDVAIAFADALNIVGANGGDFSATQSTNVVTVSHNFNGPVTDASNGIFSPGFTYNIPTQGVGEDTSTQTALISSLPSIALQVDETARSLVKTINKQATEVNAFYISGENDVPGQFLLEKNTTEDTNFYVAVLTDTATDNFNPTLPIAYEITNITTGTSTPEFTTRRDHGYTTGDEVLLTDITGTPNINGKHVITVTGTNTFTISLATSLVTASGGYVFIPEVESDNEVKPNRLYYSKLQQFEAVPALNYFDIGPQDEPIERIVSLRDSLFIFKTDGIYRLGGQNESSFSVALFDRSALIIAPDSAAVLNNQIYFLGRDGVTAVSDTGVTIISRPIEEVISTLSSDNYSTQRTASFAIASDSDRIYMLFVTEKTTDIYAQQCFVYNIFTESWTKFALGKTCGIVGSDDKIYLGANDTNFIEIERKNLNRTDYADREYSLSIPDNAVQTEEVKLEISSVENAEIGDVILQTLYLTIAQFNRLLKKLDKDAGLDDSDYFSTLGMESGDNLTSKMNELVSKLDADDSSESYTFSGTTDFATIQTEFNVIIDTLNASSEVFYSNYQYSAGTSDKEAIITAIDRRNNVLTLNYIPQVVIGPITLFKAIQTTVQWAPQFLQDPSAFKQFREGTFLFKTQSFNGATVSYKSDLSPNFESITFSAEGNGIWGGFNWGEGSWGGEGSQIPIRTLIPRKKQRCRYLFCKFQHKVARDKYLLLGVTLNGNSFSTRAYR